MSNSFRHWIKHTASVPKGFLRYYVLRLLKRKPMSGSEIINEIKRETGERWKPSPGSIYPLLAWLQSKGYIKELPVEEGLKRYMLTRHGEKFFEEQEELKKKLQKKLEVFGPPPFGGFWFGFNHEKLQELREPATEFVKALFELWKNLRENFTEESLMEACKFLRHITEEVKEMNSKIGGKKYGK